MAALPLEEERVSVPKFAVPKVGKTEVKHSVTRKTLIRACVLEQRLVKEKVLTEPVLTKAVAQVGATATISAILLAIGGSTGAAAAAEGSAAAAAYLVALCGGAAGAVLAVVLVGSWIAWMSHVQMMKDLYRKMSEITVWTDYDTIDLANRLKTADSKADATTLLCKNHMLKPDCLIDDLPNKPLDQAIDGAAYSMILRVHKTWPMKEKFTEGDVVKWMIERNCRDRKAHASLEHAFAKPIEQIQEITADMTDRVKHIQSLETVSVGRLICDDPDIPRVVMIGKTGSGKSTLCNLLYSGLFEQEYFKVGEGGAAVSTEVKMLRRVDDDHGMYVIDTPGLCDTEKRDPKFQQKVINALEGAGKVSCFILCLSMAERATDEVKKKVVGFLTDQYTEEVWKHTILVLTHCTGKKKQNLTELELTQKCWMPLDCPFVPAEVISMNNEEESDFGVEKLKKLLVMIKEMDKKPMQSDCFVSELSREEAKLEEQYKKLEKYQQEFLDIAVKDAYLVDSIQRKRAVMKKHKTVYSMADVTECHSMFPDFESMEGTNDLMIDTLKQLKGKCDEVLKEINDSVKEVRKVLGHISGDKKK